MVQRKSTNASHHGSNGQSIVLLKSLKSLHPDLPAQAETLVRMSHDFVFPSFPGHSETVTWEMIAEHLLESRDGIDLDEVDDFLIVLEGYRKIARSKDLSTAQSFDAFFARRKEKMKKVIKAIEEEELILQRPALTVSGNP